MITVFGIPASWRARSARAPAWRTAVAAPLVIWSTTPVSSAFTPSVATSGVIPKRVIAMPADEPRGDAGERRRGRSPRAASPSSPFGYFVTMIVVSVIIPGDRQVEPALLDHERLADRGDREDRRERQHREQRAAADAARGEQRADGEQQRRRDPDRREARHAKSRPVRRVRHVPSTAASTARGVRSTGLSRDPAAIDDKRRSVNVLGESGEHEDDVGRELLGPGDASLRRLRRRSTPRSLRSRRGAVAASASARSRAERCSRGSLAARARRRARGRGRSRRPSSRVYAEQPGNPTSAGRRGDEDDRRCRSARCGTARPGS